MKRLTRTMAAVCLAALCLAAATFGPGLEPRPAAAAPQAAVPVITSVSVEYDPATPDWAWVTVTVDDLDPADGQSTLFVHLGGMIDGGNGVPCDDYEYTVGADGAFRFGLWLPAECYPDGFATVEVGLWSGEEFSARNVVDVYVPWPVEARESYGLELYAADPPAPPAPPANPADRETKPSMKENPKPAWGRPKTETKLFPDTDTTKTPAQKEENKNQHRSDTGGNDATKKLAEAGYDVERNPGSPPGSKVKPDLKMEGRFADVYTPGPTKDARGVGGEVKEKVDVRKQVTRVIVNLRDNPRVTPDEIRAD